MSNSLSTTDTPRRTPRPLTPPTERDLHIYKLVKIQLREQWEVAYDHQIDRSRVSQIIKRVDRWLAAGGDPADPALRDFAARQRLSRGTLQLRLARAVELASYALEFPQPSVTTKKRYHGITEVWREEITHDAPKLSLPALRTLLDASQAIQKLDDGHPTGHKSTGQKSTQSPEPLSDDEVLRLVFDLLLGLRLRAEAQGHLPPNQNHRAAISQTLFTLLGQQSLTNSTASILNLEPGTLNPAPQSLSTPLPNASPDDSHSSLTTQFERELSESLSPTSLHLTTCDNTLPQPPKEVSPLPHHSTGQVSQP